MANPSYPVLSEKKWTIISSNVLNIVINRLNSHYRIWCTYVLHNDTAPEDTEEERDKSIVIFSASEAFDCSFTVPVDIYLWIENSDESADDQNIENIVRVDTETNDSLSGARSFSKDAIKTTGYFDDYIVQGKCHSISKRISLAQGATEYIVIDTSAMTRMMFLLPFSFSTDAGKANIDTYNIASYTGGTAIHAAPLNEVSNDIAQCVIKSGVTPSGSPGNDLREYQIGSPGNVVQSRGGNAVGANSIILGNARKVIKIVNLYAGTNVLNITMSWAEI